MKSNVSFKRALVTGAGGGLGQALVAILKQNGIEVLTTDVANASLTIDLTKNRQQLLDYISENKPDLVINNAGFGLYGDTVDLEIKEQLDMIEVNVKALVEISIHAARTMLENQQKGTILNISSAAAYLYSPFFNVYHASKAFVKSFTLGLNAELRKKGIDVLCACPGQIETHFRERASKGYPQKSDRRTLTAEAAAKHIWKQIQSKKRISLFDWKYQLLIKLSFILPHSIVESIERKTLIGRVPPNNAKAQGK